MTQKIILIIKRTINEYFSIYNSSTKIQQKQNFTLWYEKSNKVMLNKQEKNSTIRLAFLILGWGIGLDRFYEGNNKGAFLSIIGWGLIFTSIGYLKCEGVEYIDGVKNYADYSPNPLLIIPMAAALYGIVLIIRKTLKLAKQFENA